MGMQTDSTAAGVAPDLNPVGPSQEDGLKLNLDMARSLRMRRRAAIIVGVLVLIGLAIVGVTRKPYYMATSLIYIQPVIERNATDPSAGTYDSIRYDAYMGQQLLTFDRPDILGQALDQMSPDIRGMFDSDRTIAIRELRSSLIIERVAGSYQISVSMGGRDPATLAPIANAVASAYLQSGQEDDLALGGEHLQSLGQERQRIQEELERDRQEQAQLSSALGVADTAGSDANPFDTQLVDLRTKLAAARNDHQIALARLASVRGKQGANLDAASDSLTRGDAELASMESTLGMRRGALIAEMNGLTQQNPQYQKDQTELDELTEQMNNLTNQVKHKTGQTVEDQYALEAARTGDVQARLEQDLARQTAEATADTPKLQRAQDLAESIKRLQAQFADVDNAIHNLKLAQSPNFASHISLAATQPESPLPSRKVIVLVLALPLALFCALATAVILQKLDSRVYIGADVERVLDFSPMAVLPVSEEVGYKVAEEFLFRLVAGLDQAHRVAGASTFVFTACSQGTAFDELVSSIAAELEILGYRTSTLSAAEALSPIDMSGKGTFSEWGDSTELARAGGETGLRIRRESIIDEHLERLKQKVDFLFIKSGPLRSSSETEFVVRLGDVSVLVVESGKTTRQEMRTCLALIRRLRARGLAAVVSDLKLRNADEEFIESVRFVEQRQGAGGSRPNVNDGMLTLGRR
jgi:succinoglycan biosynthesis transport protein ExoP